MPLGATQVGRLAVLTSGGDAQGMNAAVRAVVRTALHRRLEVYAVYEGYEGLVEGDEFIRPVSSRDVGGILHRGGTAIGSARSEAFRTREGRRRAAGNLVRFGIDALVVIGGDGSLTGADVFRREWPGLLEELVEAGSITRDQVDEHPRVRIVGLVGSIDNDMVGTDVTIGADTALHRITEAVDAIRSTAASHQRTFVIEVMGRRCGHLALMASLATGANWVLIPEHPPEEDDWEEAMCAALAAGRRIGRRQSLVIVAEGARDRHGNPITSEHVKDALEHRLGEDTRVTILGHVQRGGAPSAFDRYLGTLQGCTAVEQLLAGAADEESQLVGFREHQVVTVPLMGCVEQTHRLADRLAEHDYQAAMEMRGGSFREYLKTLRTLTQARPRRDPSDRNGLRLALLHAGGPAPGMNTAARAAVRLGLDAGHTMLGVRNGFDGLRDGAIDELDWMSVTEWVSRGGAELGISRHRPEAGALAEVAAQLEAHRIDGLLMIGGWSGYWAAHDLHARRHDWPEVAIPIVCLPASINNDLPGSELSVGADTALNSIVSDVDKIKQSAVAAGRSFIVEVMGRDCGYLALLGGLATGAERVYLPEEGITLADLQADVEALTAMFRDGQRVGLILRNENAERIYTTSFIHALFEKEGGDLFDVREAVLGHVQQGGDPSPFDRIQATRLAARCMEYLIDQAGTPEPGSALIGLQAGKVRFTDLGRLPDLVEPGAQRPARQRWLSLRPIADVMTAPARSGTD